MYFIVLLVFKFDFYFICFLNRALQEAQDIFGVDFDYDDFEKYGEDEYEEDEEDEYDDIDDEAEETERR